MVSTAVVYVSRTGFTKRYAQWISESLQAPLIECSDTKTVDLSPYDTIVFGSWVCAGGVKNIKWLEKVRLLLPEKKYYLFYVGGNLPGAPPEKQVTNKLSKNAKLIGVDKFYYPGGYDPERMSFGFKIMISLFKLFFGWKIRKNPDTTAALKSMTDGCDYTDKKYIESLIEKVKQP